MPFPADRRTDQPCTSFMPATSLPTKSPIRSLPGEPPAEQLGAWRLVRLLHSGRWCDAYVAAPAECASPRADYVLKVLRSEHIHDSVAVGMLRREAALGARVAHAHLAAILAAHVSGPPYYVVMPLLAGSTLRELLCAADAMCLPRALWIARQVADALAALHSAGWLHCDIKPENIQVSCNGHTTLLDLGLARPLSARDASIEFVGTPNYAAPECFSRSSNVMTPASDVYSLGVTLFEALTGVLPRPPLRDHRSDDGQTPAASPRRHRPELPVAAARLVQQMLANEPLRRPSAQELVGRLLELEIEYLEEWIRA